MNIEILYKNNNLLVNGQKVDFIHTIKDVQIVGENVIVLLDIPQNDNSIDNLYSVSSTGEINWRSQNLRDIFPTGLLLSYEQIRIEDNVIIASDFYERYYFININDGTIIKREIYR